MIINNYNYEVFRNDRSCSIGGGSCILAMKCGPVKCSRVTLSPYANSLLIQSRCELVCLNICYFNSKFRIILVYRPPKSSFPDSSSLLNSSIALSNLLDNLCNIKMSCIILGDFNLPDVDWSSGFSHTQATQGLLDFFSNHGFVQFVNQSTRFDASGSGNILDVILSNDQFAVRIDNVGVPFCTSDHCTVNFDIMRYDNHTSDPCHRDEFTRNEFSGPFVQIYDWRNGNYPAINSYLDSFDWNFLFGFRFDSDSLWYNFKQILWSVINMFVPMKRVHHGLKYNVRRYPKFVRQLLSRKAAIWRKLRTSRSSDQASSSTDLLYESYRRVAGECKQAILDYDIACEKRILDANNRGAFFRYVNSKIGRPNGIAPLLDPSGVLICDDQAKANLLNEYFFLYSLVIMINYPYLNLGLHRIILVLVTFQSLLL